MCSETMVLVRESVNIIGFRVVSIFSFGVGVIGCGTGYYGIDGLGLDEMLRARDVNSRQVGCMILF